MNKENFVAWSIEATIRLVLIFLLLFVAFLIFKPFLLLMVWSIITAVALYPLFLQIKKLLRGKKALSAILITLLTMSVLVVPAFLFIGVLVESVGNLGEQLMNGSFKIPLPPDEVKDWPLIGHSVNDIWQLTATNTEAAFEQYAPQLVELGRWLLESVGGLTVSILIFIGALLISGILLVKADDGYDFTVRLATKLVGKEGLIFVNNARETIQSVVKGVLGVALIQSLLIGIGFWAVGVPGASILTLLVFILAII